MSLKAPFPYLGSKARLASDINERLGETDVYAEPFAGSLAVLLARAPARREVVCDRSGHIANFWRAMKWDPDAVADAADWPTIHHDLTARHKALTKWGVENAERITDDPRFFDAEMAGWWAWGKSNWIGNDWCLSDRQHDKRPFVHDHESGLGVMPHPQDKIPWSAQAVKARGVRERDDRLVSWFRKLQGRLRHVIVLNRSWEAALTNTMLCANAGGYDQQSVMLDPPYITGRRSGDLYVSDRDGTSNQVARDSYEWAVEHGHEYRIAYCSFEGDFPVPDGWDAQQWQSQRDHRAEQVMFSPACEKARQQGGLF